MSHTIYAANGKSVTFTDACANKIIPLINRSFVYKAKEGRYVRICHKFVSDLRQVGGFLRVLRFPPPIKLTATI